MTDLVAELSERARSLAPEERARLAEELLASLEGDQEPEVGAAWDEEKFGSELQKSRAA